MYLSHQLVVSFNVPPDVIWVSVRGWFFCSQFSVQIVDVANQLYTYLISLPYGLLCTWNGTWSIAILILYLLFVTYMYIYIKKIIHLKSFLYFQHCMLKHVIAIINTIGRTNINIACKNTCNMHVALVRRYLVQQSWKKSVVSCLLKFLRYQEFV